MAYVSLYRKYRSQTFGDLIGQDHVVKTIQNAISSERIAHSYLFTGPRGTGKTSMARLLAKALCCEAGPTPEPDNTCAICQSITAGACIDVMEMDAASESGVDEVREQIVETIEYRPMMCRYKVFIIDEVHDLSGKAFDALLKTIEEPPPHVVFILATTEFNKVPTTIRSRCQKFDFHRAEMSDLVARLTYVVAEEGYEAEPAAIVAIARMADGGFRDALTLLEQAILTCEGSKITLEQVYDQLGLVSEEVADGLLLAMKEADVPKITAVLSQVSRLGRDPRSVVESLLYRLKDLTDAIYQVESGTSDAARDAALHETAVRLGRETILRMRGELAEAFKVIRDITIPRLWLESELIRLSLPKPAVAPAETAQPRAEARPAQAVVKPRPASPEPARVQESSAPAKQTPPTAERPREERAPAPKPAQAYSDAESLWNGVKGALPPDTVISKRLMESTGIQLTETEIVVELTREFDLDWLNSDPRRIGHINKTVREHTGRELMARFRVSKAEATAIGSEPVESPAEGQRLEDLAREIFGEG